MYNIHRCFLTNIVRNLVGFIHAIKGGNRVVNLPFISKVIIKVYINQLVEKIWSCFW